MLAAYDSKSFLEFIELIKPSIAGFGPELLLIGTISAVLVCDLFLSREKARGLFVLAAAGAIGALFLVVRQLTTLGDVGLFGAIAHRGQEMVLERPMLWETSFSRFFQVIFLIGTIVSMAMAHLSKELEGRPMAEFYASMLTALLGCFIMSEANDLLMAFIGVELLSLPSYALVGWIKRRRASSEAAVKYVIYGSVSSGFMVYGFSLLFGMTGTLQLSALSGLFGPLGPGEASAMAYAPAIAALLAFGGIAFKISAVPFHFWTPDVYQGAPTSVTAWLAVVSKAAGLALAVRFIAAMGIGASAVELPWPQLIALIAAVTMTLGNLAALWQENVKRMLAYSSIAHVGYLLMGLAAFSAAYASGGGEGWKAIAFYAVAYLVMNLGGFLCVVLFSNQLGNEEIDGLKGMGVRAPVTALCLAVFLFSLIGLPPTVGFSGKFQLFLAAVTHKMTWLAVVAGVNTAISAYYYMRVVKVMYFDKGDTSELRIPMLGRGLAVAHAVVAVYLGVLFGGLLEWTGNLTIF